MPKKQPRQGRPAEPAPPARSRSWGAAALLVGMGCLVYANSLKAPFLWDDHRTIEDNQTIRGISLTTLVHPQRQTPVAGRPLPNLSFAVNYQMGGLEPVGYHAVNVAIHILVALALFGVLRRLLGEDGWALTCASIWLVHPLATEPVDYVTQRTESMVALWLLLTLYASIRSWEEGGSRFWMRAAVVANLCGMATKESMAISPIVVLLCDRCFRFSTWGEAWRERSRFYLAIAAGWILLAILLLQSPFANAEGFEVRVTPWTYFLNQGPIIWRYLRLAFWPAGLVLDYGFPQPLTLRDVWLPMLLLGGLAALTLAALARAPKVGFWGAWFFITLAPASSLIPIGTEVGAERRMYIPLVALVVLTTGLWPSAAFSGLREAGRANALSVVLAVAVVAALGVATIQRNAEYRTGLSIWQTVLDRRPGPRAHENIAVELRDADRIDDAIAHLRIAAPALPEARHALGSALLVKGEIREGIEVLKDFVTNNPNDRDIQSGREELTLAVASLLDSLLKGERFSEAEDQARTLVSLRPDDARAHNLLGVALASQGKIEAAGKEFAEAVRLDPSLQQARDNLDRALRQGSGTAR